MLRLVVIVLALGALASCETVKGMGRDVSNAGRAMDRTF